jgi:hypothetical protein
VRKILSAKARLQGEKRSKVEYLASIFNAAGAFLSQYCRVMKCKQTLGSVHNSEK